MCKLCKFEQGTSKFVLKVECIDENTGHMTQEIRPLLNGEFIYFIRYFCNGNLISKSGTRIDYCPRCGRKLILND